MTFLRFSDTEDVMMMMMMVKILMIESVSLRAIHPMYVVNTPAILFSDKFLK